jgi:hypothetical protein
LQKTSISYACVSSGCSIGAAKNTLGSDYSDYFDDALLYEMRDNVLLNSLIGEKYYRFYYYSSLLDITDQLSLSELAQIATSLPTIYSIYNRIKNSEYQSLVFTESEKNKILDVLNIYKNKKISANFESIINNIISDIEQLDGKSIAYLNQKIY